MQRNILWTGLEYYSLENCLVDFSNTGTRIRSAIVGKYNEKLYYVQYEIRTDGHWQTIFVELKARHSNQELHVLLESDGNGNWTRNGDLSAEFSGCRDVDLPVTPFTNTLPVNRLKLGIGQQQQIDVIYLDILESQVKSVSQQYTRVAEKIYHYENVPNDFEADIEVDEFGLVVDYPVLFKRTLALETSYQ